MAVATASLGALRAQAAPQEWWAYRPLARPAVPAVQDAAWCRNDVDRFVLARLEGKGLRPAPAADAATLIRRVTYDLTGLPPTPEEVLAFADDRSPDAWDKLIERLLGSPQYGVQWGRHWLDLVRYAETDSFERDNKKPEAWRYRDWVVDALNRDVPYGRFLSLQLAGDETPEPDVSAIVATGFYRLGIWDDEPTDAQQAVYDDFDGIVDTTARAMLGTSMGCARCHDHKRDPITTVDYYSFLAFFENLRPYKEHQASGLNPENYVATVPIDGAEREYEAALDRFAAERAALGARARAAADAAYLRLPADVRVQLLAAAAKCCVARFSADRTDPQRLWNDLGGPHGEVHGQVVAVDGVRGSALRFDGDDSVVVPPLVRDSFTITFWVRSTHPGRGKPGDDAWFSGDALIDADVPGTARDFGIGWHDDGRITAGVGDPDTFVASAPGHADGQWHHVAFTRDRDSGRFSLYVDGARCAEATPWCLSPRRSARRRHRARSGRYRGRA
jgi:hypothetical protein